MSAMIRYLDHWGITAPWVSEKEEVQYPQSCFQKWLSLFGLRDEGRIRAFLKNAMTQLAFCLSSPST
ncbi:hypothetical protein TNCV_2391061 [Trichonephila clavipes]|nr:hypothetical protein TNCV_2391061 [Trichonephila clavipes]